MIVTATSCVSDGRTLSVHLVAAAMSPIRQSPGIRDTLRVLNGGRERRGPRPESLEPQG